MLLVLDNFEQVLAAAPAVAGLLPAAPGVKLLVTSRRGLGVTGEQTFSVPPLAVPAPGGSLAPDDLSRVPGVRLFVERAQARDPDFALTPANALAVAEICRRLDGLPLALELAAARTQDLTVEEIHAQLNDRLGLLVGRLRGRAARQQTIRGAIDWSYHLLTPGEQQVFRRLAVFQGGFTLAAGAVVCGEPGAAADRARVVSSAGPNAPALTASMIDVPAAVQALINHSLVQPREGESGEPRFAMLETIHAYAREQLTASGEATELSREHAAYFRAFALDAEAAIEGPQRPAWLRRIGQDLDNLLQALEWATRNGVVETSLWLGIVLSRYWLVFGGIHEGRARLATILAMNDGQAPGLWRARATALYVAGHLAYGEDDYAASGPLLEQSLEIWRALGDQGEISETLRTLAVVRADEGDYVTAHALLAESLTIVRRLGDRRKLLATLNSLGGILVDQGDSAARPVLEESLSLAAEPDEIWSRAITNVLLARLDFLEQKHEAGRRRLEESLMHSRQRGGPFGIGWALRHLANIDCVEGRYAAARAHLTESLRISRDRGDVSAIVECLDGFGRLALAEGQVLAAARLWAAVATHRAAYRMPAPPIYERAFGALIPTARAQVDAAAWTAAWAAGETLPLEEACALALIATPSADSPI